MPFVHEDGNVSITQIDGYSRKPSSLSARNSLSNPERLQRILQREAANSQLSGVNQNLQNQLAAQRRIAHAKLQKAKMMGNGGMSAVAMNFQREHHNNSHRESNQNQNDPMFVASRRARSNNFTLKETFDLLKIWASPEMQWQMKHNFRNFRVWEAISFSMHEMGHDRTAIQCKNRIQNLTSIFYRIKKSKQDYRSFNFPYYKLIGDVLDGKKNGPSSMSPPPGVSSMMQNGSFTPSREGQMSFSPTSQTAGNAAHLGLIEEYQRLINGNPDAPTGGRSSSNNSNSGLNVLSPEISLRVDDDEGSSPSRIESSTQPRTSNSMSTASSVQKNALSSRNGNSAGINSTITGSGSLIKNEQDDSVTVTVDETANASELDHGENIEDDLEDSELLQEEDYRSDELVGSSYPSARTKRSFSASFGGGGGGGSFGLMKSGHPAKRPRVGSLSGHSTSAFMMDETMNGGHNWTSELVDLERQRIEIDREWLALERERAENEKAWMIMDSERAENDRQFFQCVTQCLSAMFGVNQEEEDTGEQQENENENENENQEEEDCEGNGYQEEHEQDPNEENDETTENAEIHKMIEENGAADDQE